VPHNLTLSVGLIDKPEGGRLLPRVRLIAASARRELGTESAYVEASDLSGMGPVAQAAWMGRHGIVVIAHGSRTESLLFAPPCTAVVQMFPPYRYRPGKALPLALAAGGITYTGYTGQEPGRHTWQRINSLGFNQAEKDDGHVLATPLEVGSFLPTLARAREYCLLRTSKARGHSHRQQK